MKRNGTQSVLGRATGEIRASAGGWVQIELLAKIKGWMAPEKQDVTVHDANRMTDDELARIAAGSGDGSAAAAASP